MNGVRPLVGVLLLATLVACGGVAPSPNPTASGDAGASLVPLASGEPPPWEQPVPGAVDATPWHEVGADQEIDPGGGPWADPGALLAATGRFFEAQTPGGEVAVRLVEHDADAAAAIGHVRILTVGDDSVAGMDLRLELGEVEGGWRIVSVEERLHCRRGVDGERCV